MLKNPNEMVTQVTIRSIDSSPALEAHVHDCIEKLKHVCQRIISCHVVIEIPHSHKHTGKLFNVRLDLSVPGKELLVTHKTHEEVYVAINNAFAAAKRQLIGKLKKYAEHRIPHQSLQGRVVRLAAKEGFGFIEDQMGNEYYFNLDNHQEGQAKNLLIGDAVDFTPTTMPNGMHALRVNKSQR